MCAELRDPFHPHRAVGNVPSLDACPPRRLPGSVDDKRENSRPPGSEQGIHASSSGNFLGHANGQLWVTDDDGGENLRVEDDLLLLSGLLSARRHADL